MGRSVSQAQRRIAARAIACGGSPDLAARASGVHVASVYRWRAGEDFSLLVAEEVSKLRRAIAAEIPRDEVRRALGVAES